MRIMLDSNVLLSAIVFKSKKLADMIDKVSEEYTLVLCSYVIDEVYRVTRRKVPRLVGSIDRFLSRLSFEFVYSPKTVVGEKLFEIRDEDDYPVLYSAITADVDILITGDGDFSEVEITRPEIMTPAEFIEEYM